jgi:hypothetical protein|tara:strand:+ start:665 stop:1387 length:723 start_codon:yes stop_codon:yes gene_type:complete
MLDNIKIMQFADGTLDPADRDQVKKEIDSNPEYQKILKDYMYTADVLANLGNEIRSLELPSDLKNKISAFNEVEKYKIKSQKSSFNFFSFFNIKYSAIAAAFVLFFTGGFYTNQMIALKEQVPTMQTVANSGSIQLRGSSAEFVTNFYKWFNEESFVNSINKKIKNLKQGEKFNTDLVDLNQAPVYFILDKEFKNKEGNICKIINYDKKVVLEQSSKAYFISLAVCKEVDRWKLLAITLN